MRRSIRLPQLLLTVALCAPVQARAQARAQAAPDVQATDAAADRATWAPTARGVRLLGGYAAAGGFVDRYQSVSVEPQIGRFVADGLAVSLRVGASGAWGSFSEVDVVDGALAERERRTQSYGVAVGPSVTKYIGRAGAAVYPFVGVGAYGRITRATATLDGLPGETSTYRDLSGSARAGLMVPVARNVGIEAQIVGSVYDLSPRVQGAVGFSAGISTFLY